MKEIIFYSNNQNKIIEISKFFFYTNLKIKNLNNFAKIESPKETGRTFEENAKIKSSFGNNIFNKICFADDSGICIEAMKGEPGVQSKNFIENNIDSNNALKSILSVTSAQNNFNAFFQTSICLSLNKKKHIFFNGKIKGQISKEIKGSCGFGYDPIFIPNGYNLTFAEMTLEEKNSISHRSIALTKLKDYCLKLI